MKLNSDLVQWVLKFGMSKAGPFVAAAAAWIAAHVLIWTHAANFLPAAAALKIQNALQGGMNEIGLGLVAILYAFIVHRQSQGVKVLKAQLDMSDVKTPALDLNSGAVGNNTLDAAAAVTQIPVQVAAENVGVKVSG